MSFPFDLPIILDSITIDSLIYNGMPKDVCCYKWIIENSDIMINLKKEFIKAGSNAICAPTYGASRENLKRFGLENDIERINLELVKLTKRAVGNKSIIVGGSLSPTGYIAKPYGNADFDKIYSLYFEQAKALKEGGADFLIFESQTSLADMRAGVLVAKELKLPVFVTVVLDESGKTITGSKFLPITITLEALGADAVGISGLRNPLKNKNLLMEVLPHSCIPLIARSSVYDDKVDNIRFILSPEEFAKQMKELFDNGIEILGATVGVTPAHIEAMVKELGDNKLELPKQKADFEAGTIESEAFFLGDDIVLSEPLECGYDLGEALIDLDDENVSVALVEVNTIEDADILIENSGMTRMAIDVVVSDFNVLEYTLKNFQGRLMIDSGSSIDKKILKNLAKKYGAIIY